MAHGLNSVVIKRNANTLNIIKSDGKMGGIGSRRIFAPQFKLQVLDSYRNDVDCKGNQRATARKYGIHRRQIQKWLQVETNLRNSVMKIKQQNNNNSVQQVSETKKCVSEMALSNHRQQDDIVSRQVVYTQQHSTGIEQPMYVSPSNEQRVPYIHQTTSPVQFVYSQLSPPSFVNNSRLNTTVPSPEVHQVPTTTLVLNNYDCEVNTTTESVVDYSAHACLTPPPPAHSELFITDYTCDESCTMYDHVPSSAYPIDLSVKKTPTYCSCSPVHISPLLYCPPPPAPPIYNDSVYCLYHSPSYYRNVDLPPLVIQPNISPNSSSSMISPSMPSPSNVPLQSNHNKYEIWDLSTKNKENKKTYHILNTVNSSNSIVKKPVKLFKPYLLDDEDLSSSSDFRKEHKALDNYFQDYNTYLNNNNEVYKINSDVHCNTSTNEHTLSEINIKDSDDIEENEILDVKQTRQSYSLNFKLNAIECYYNDEICRGNQRAVANKYNVHRRQVQKWLKQEQELRERVHHAASNQIIVS